MAERRFRAPPSGTVRLVPLDDLVALYHRPSGITHLLASPAPEILEVLDAGPLSLDALLAALEGRYAVGDADRGALLARLDELAEAGLVERL